MQNFYDLFRKILTEGSDYRASETDLKWIADFMNNNDTSIELKSTQLAVGPDGPIMRFDGSYKGQPLELFELLSEACFQSPVILETVNAVTSFFAEHVPTCPHCQKTHGRNCPGYQIIIRPTDEKG